MGKILQLLIKVYWALIPIQKRRSCIFKISCSRHVYHVIESEGWVQGLKAFRFRFQNCRSGTLFFHHPVSGEKQLLLPNGEVLIADEIAERFVNDK